MKLRNFVQFLMLIVLIVSFSACTPSPKFNRYRTIDPPKTNKVSSSNKSRARKAEDPKSNYKKGQVLKGTASYYGPGFHGKLTASGEVYDQNALTCAHKYLPFGTVLRVKLLSTGQSIVLRVTDRGPFVDDRILDLSVEAARRIGMIREGTGFVEAEIISLGDE